jgi:putative transposase
MPRIPRGDLSEHVYHVLNRGNGGAAVFTKDGDYRAFLTLLADAKTRYPVKIFAFCLMPNHLHLVLQSSTGAVLSHFMQWCFTSHVRRYHRHQQTHGHVWQGRFKSFLIQQDVYLLTVLRYVLRNPVRAGLVSHTYEWPWSSRHYSALIDPWPVKVPSTWNEWVEEPLYAHELDAIRTCVNRQAPFGTHAWRLSVAQACGLQSTLRPRGRPAKPQTK